MSKNSIIIAAIIIVVLGAIVFYLPGNKGGMPLSTTPAAGQGKVVIGISDASADIQSVTSIMMTVDKVEVQNADQAWVTVSSGVKQYDLLQLKQSGAVALLADVNLPVGTYNQIRLDISKVEVTASGMVQAAKLPSGTLKIVGRTVVEEGKTATAVLDFKADKSLHVTGNGRFILAPVVNLQTKSDTSVSERSDDTLDIKGGKSEDEVNVGMDERGEVKDDFELDVDAKLDIDANGAIHLFGGGAGSEGSGSTEGEGVLKFSLLSQNNSGIAGTATLQDEDGKTKVTLKLNVVSTGILGLVGVSLATSHPAHIHYGSCASLGAVKYSLNSTVDGRSDTTINASLADLKAQLPLAINVHKSDAEIGVYVACTDLKL